MLSKFEYDRQLNPNFTPGSFELSVQQMNVYRPRKGTPLVVVGSQNAVERSHQQTLLEGAQISYRLIDSEADSTEDLADVIAKALL